MDLRFAVLGTLSAMGLAPLACGNGPSARLPEANNPGYRNLRKEIGDKYAKIRSYTVEDLSQKCTFGETLNPEAANEAASF